MKYVYTTVAGLSLVALAFAPATAGDQKSKTSDTLQLPGSGASATVDGKADVTTPKADVGVGTQTQGSVTTDSPSASPSTQLPSTPAPKDTVNPSMKSDPTDKPKP